VCETDESIERETPKTVKGIVAQRERKVRELDRVGMQKVREKVVMTSELLTWHSLRL
jgi:hypothetical protein